jgi:hypothetical protein
LTGSSQFLTIVLLLDDRTAVECIRLKGQRVSLAARPRNVARAMGIFANMLRSRDPRTKYGKNKNSRRLLTKAGNRFAVTHKGTIAKE